ncbi:MAG: F0F1 ATP synthase subunit gamma [Magnetococcales bacterium]|nr:F0F1 ATP synthase subunit gamma [Magnetococcales bacterium]
MPSLKQLRLRIRSVSSTKQITKAMKMVAAAKLRRSQERATAARPYSQRMGRMMRSVATIMDGQQGSPPLLSGYGDDVRRIELVVLTADRGLCGSFNSGVVRAVRNRVVELQREGFAVTLTCVGRKGQDVLKRQFGAQIRKTHTGIAHRLTFHTVEREIAQELVQAFEDRQFEVCYLVYNTFKSAMSQVLTWQQIMPLPNDAAQKNQDGPRGSGSAAASAAHETAAASEGKKKGGGRHHAVQSGGSGQGWSQGGGGEAALLQSMNRQAAAVEEEESGSTSYFFEPDEGELLNALLPRNVAVQLFQALVESDASEHGARMTAMDNAVRNASEMIRKLRIKFNRTRQAAITTELMEIIGGAESLKG